MVNNLTEAPAGAGRRATWESVRRWFLGGIAVGAVVGTVASFYESFSGLVDWFRRIGFHGDRAVFAPLMIDLVATFGEVVLVLAIVEGWRSRSIRPLAWVAVVWGLALSVVGNAGRNGLRLTTAGVFDMAWNAVPPLSLAILMTVALAVVKLWFKGDEDGEDEGGIPALPEFAALALVHFRDALETGRIPGVPAIKKTLGCAQPKATGMRDYLRLLRADLERLADEAEVDAEGNGGRPRAGGVPRLTSALPPAYLVTDGDGPGGGN
jgi:hypothetical protein